MINFFYGEIMLDQEIIQNDYENKSRNMTIDEIIRFLYLYCFDSLEFFANYDPDLRYDYVIIFNCDLSECTNDLIKAALSLITVFRYNNLKFNLINDSNNNNHKYVKFNINFANIR